MKRRPLLPQPHVDLRIGGYEITGTPRLSDRDLLALRRHLAIVVPPLGLVSHWYTLLAPNLPASIDDIMALEASPTCDVIKYTIRRV